MMPRHLNCFIQVRQGTGCNLGARQPYPLRLAVAAPESLFVANRLEDVRSIEHARMSWQEMLKSCNALLLD
jgi:hypothetical protein